MNQPKVKVEPAVKSEADWSSGLASSAGLPGFVEGEFSHMIELAEIEGATPTEIGEPDAAAVEHPLGSGFWEGKKPPSEQERVAVMAAHMDRLLGVAGKDREGSRIGLGRLVARLSQRWGDA